MFKDQYLLDFVNVEDADEEIDEKVLEHKIVNNINEVEDIKITKRKKETKEKKQENVSVHPDTFSFDDLPNISDEQNNPVKKLINWGKQLF